MQKNIMSRYVKVACLSFLITACAAIPNNAPVQNRPVGKPVTQLPPPPNSAHQNGSQSSHKGQSNAQNLQQEIFDLWRVFPGKTGISVHSLDEGWTVGQRLDDLFPQQSVSKLWVAMTILDQVDRGKLRLDDEVVITRNDLAVFYQPVRDKVLREGEVRESVASLLERAITQSDNTANDSLLRTAGGPEAVHDFIAKHQLGAIRFGPGERLLQSGIAGLTWKQEYSIGRNFYTARANLSYDKRKSALDNYLADPIDGASPRAISLALAKLSRGKLLSYGSSSYLLDLLNRVRSGPNRLKGGVPSGWSIGHKTGTGQDLPPISTGYNDVGILVAPDGRQYMVAVMLGDTTASIPERMQLMQSVVRAIVRNH
ncbi:serine hydrolase [Sphingorhabdus lutea]|uniref:serine hydrolase n=1 Tax=Sphingorhabdus lutea TaxID=1913578 RepID=UPI000A7A261B|nr:serine hydrolase [Sphingorhabdus lutea]